MVYDEKLKEELRTKIREAAAFLNWHAPHLSRVLKEFPIILTDEIKRAAVDDSVNIYINPEFFKKLTHMQTAFVLAHEVFHKLFQDVERSKIKGIPPIKVPGIVTEADIWNWIADAVNNTMLINEFPDIVGTTNIRESIMALHPYLYSHIVQMLEKAGYYTTEAELMKMTKEEIFDLVMKHMPKGGIGIGIGDSLLSDDIHQGTIKDPSKIDPGDVLMPGNPDIKDAKTPEERKKAIKDILKRALDEKKRAGKKGGYFETLVREILEPDIPWYKYIVQYVNSALSVEVEPDWRRPSRRIIGAWASGETDIFIPWRRFVETPTVWILIDVSGSIGDYELDKFFSEVYNLLKTGLTENVTVVAWDDEVKASFELTSPEDVKKLRFERGGGTTILSALQYVNPKFKYDDIITVLTDGEIYDIKDREVRYLLNRFASMANVAIWGTTGKEIDIPRWINIRIRLPKKW